MEKTLVNYDNDTTSFVVTGILQNVPQNSQMQFDALIPFSTIAQPDWMNNWGGNWLEYILGTGTKYKYGRAGKKISCLSEKTHVRMTTGKIMNFSCCH